MPRVLRSRTPRVAAATTTRRSTGTTRATTRTTNAGRSGAARTAAAAAGTRRTDRVETMRAARQNAVQRARDGARMRIIESPSSSSSASSSENNDDDDRMSDENVFDNHDISQASVIVISPPPARRRQLATMSARRIPHFQPAARPTRAESPRSRAIRMVDVVEQAERRRAIRMVDVVEQAERRRAIRMVDVVEQVDLDDSRLDDPNNVTYMRDSFVVNDDEDSDESSSSDGSIADSDGNELDDEMVGDANEDDEEEEPSEPAADLSVSMPPDVIRSSEHGHCSICFEEAPYDPMGCLICRQLIGCKRCVTKWYETGKKKAARREENADNHFMCPLCRHKWEGAPEVDSIFLLDS